jgi:DNA-directed RNA polymerase subunit omega
MILPIETLLEKASDPFHLVILAARRTRQLSGGAPKLTSVRAAKNTTIALNEILEGKISYTQLEDPSKPKTA